MYSELLARLRLLSLYYQTAHWQSKGLLFYADHLLFERLYNDASKRIDQVAEKGIGVTGDVSIVNLIKHLELISAAANMLPTETEASAYLQASLKMEINLQDFCKIQDGSELSPGSKNMIGDIADESEARAYLIKQRLSK